MNNSSLQEIRDLQSENASLKKNLEAARQAVEAIEPLTQTLQDQVTLQINISAVR